jgi:hypothetical protein
MAFAEAAARRSATGRPGLREPAGGELRDVLPLVEQYEVSEGRRLNLLAQRRDSLTPEQERYLSSWGGE